MNPKAKIAILIGGTVITSYAIYALYSGWVISTWGQYTDRSQPIYWITVGLLLLLGGANLFAGFKLTSKTK